MKFATTVTQEAFLEALDNYVTDNYDKTTLRTLKNYNSQIGVEKSDKRVLAFRGLFFNNQTPAQVEELMQLGWTTDAGLSYTTDRKEALAFAYGSNVYEFEHPNPNDLLPTQVGIVIVKQFAPEEIILDFDFALRNNYPGNAIEGHEILVRPRKRDCAVVYHVCSRGVRAKYPKEWLFD